MPVTTESPTDTLPALQRQADALVAAGWSAVPAERLAELAALAPVAPYVLVVPGPPPVEAIGRVSLRGRAGFTTMEGDDLARFVPTPDLDVPAGAYVLSDVDTGAEHLGVRPDDALPVICAQGRTPLTLEEGLAVLVQHPEWLRERNCFELLGSRAGDKRVTGLWLSKGAPRLGWCWGGNPHTWLGMASAARRLG